MYLEIDRSECLSDEKVRIFARNLAPGELFKIELSLKHRTGTHMGYGIFRASAEGIVDPSRDPPVRGTYDGVNAMGLFYSLLPTEDVRLGATVWATPPDPYKYRIRLYNSSGEEMDSISHIRHWRHPLVRVHDIESELFTGTLYMPPGDGPFPTIIDFSGTGGGIRQHRGALLASHGFAALSLPYFGYKNLPKSMPEVDINYFLLVVDWLSAQSFVGKIGMQGNSFGGIVCCLVADRTDKISSYCIINGIHAMEPNAPILENGKELPHGELPEDVEYPFVFDALLYTPALQRLRVPPEAEFQFGKCKMDTQFRIVASLDDMSATAIKSAHILRDKLLSKGLHVEVDAVPGGHLMEPPSLPHMPYVYSGFTSTYQLYGGEVYPHGCSQEAVWRRTKDFFARSLGAPKPLPATGECCKL